MCSLFTLTRVFKKAFQTFTMTRILFCSALPTPSTHDRPLKRFTVNAPVIAVSSTGGTVGAEVLAGLYKTQPAILHKHSCGSKRSRPSRLHMKQARGDSRRSTLEHLEWNQYAFFECRWGWGRIQHCSSSKGEIVCVKILRMLMTRKWVFLYLALWDVLASASDLVYAMFAVQLCTESKLIWNTSSLWLSLSGWDVFAVEAALIFKDRLKY